VNPVKRPKGSRRRRQSNVNPVKRPKGSRRRRQSNENPVKRPKRRPQTGTKQCESEPAALRLPQKGFLVKKKSGGKSDE